jgi:hypothetical protein
MIGQDGLQVAKHKTNNTTHYSTVEPHLQIKVVCRQFCDCSVLLEADDVDTIEKLRPIRQECDMVEWS